MVEKILDEAPNLKINVWYLNDGSLCDSPHDLANALSIVEEVGPNHGLHLNHAKSLLYIPEDCDASSNYLPSDIPIIMTDFTVLLPHRSGPSFFCEMSVIKEVEKLRESLSRLANLCDSQIEKIRFHSSLALPKVDFSLRSCLPCVIQQATVAFDDLMLEALSDRATSPLSKWSWLKASLTSSHGGLSLRRATLHAPAAYIGSLEQSRAMIARIMGHTPDPPKYMTSAVSALAAGTKRPDWGSLEDIDVPCHQCSLSHCIDEAAYLQLLDFVPDTRSKALVLS